MKTILPEAAFPTTLYAPRQGRRPIAIGAVFVTAWLSTATGATLGADPQPTEGRARGPAPTTATAAPVGADRQAPTKHPGSHGVESRGLKSHPPESQTLRLRFDDGLLSLHASQRSFAEVLGAIQKETGIRLHYPLPLPGSITESFTALPIKRALERLFGPEASLMLRYTAGGEAPGPLAVPKEVWLIGKIHARGAGALAAGAEESETRPQAPIAAPEAPPNPAAAPAVTAEDQALLPGLGDEEAIDGLIGMARDEDPEMRLQALATLSQGTEGSEAEQAIVHSAIDAALTDQDPRVRGQALQALASREGAEAMPHLREALRDPDPGVRILAIEHAGSGEQGKALLEEALSDQDETVRAVARARLEPDGLEGDPL